MRLVGWMDRMQSGERREMKVSGSMLFMASIAASAVWRWRFGGIDPSYEAVAWCWMGVCSRPGARLGIIHPHLQDIRPIEHHGRSDSVMDSHWVDTRLDGLSTAH